MSVPYANVIVDRKKGNRMIVSLENQKIVPLHWDDRFYIADCPECGDEVFARTSKEIKEILDDHCVVIKGGYCPQCEWSAMNCHCVEYGLPLPE
jgi:hypothetical protein